MKINKHINNKHKIFQLHTCKLNIDNSYIYLIPDLRIVDGLTSGNRMSEDCLDLEKYYV